MSDYSTTAIKPGYLSAQLLFWGSYCLLNIIFISLWGIFSPFMFTIFLILSVLLGIISHGLRYLLKPCAGTWSLGRIFLHLLWLLPLMAVATQLILHVLIYSLLLVVPAAAPNTQPASVGSFLGYSINTGIMLLLWSILYLLRREFYTRRDTEIQHWRLQAQLNENQLDFLRSQINSHFLFNTINNLRALISEDTEGARAGLANLSILLRGILHSDSKLLVPLHQELEWVRGYLALESLQLEQRLQCEWFIDETLLAAELPPLALQTLAENAIKHGIAAKRDGGMLRISAYRSNRTHWTLEVSNPVADTASEHQGNKIGLHNLRARLKLVFNDSASLELEINTRFIARIKIPLIDIAL